MSDAQSALDGASYEGLLTVRDAGLRGMITLRGDLNAPEFAKAVKSATGLALPGSRQIVTKGDVSLAWMSPDELLILTAYDDAPKMVSKLEKALAGQHHLVANVSDARAIFTLSGPRGREVLAKLTPADLSPEAFGAGEIRRSRLAQIAAAFWLGAPDEITLVCFRSTADYAFRLLSNAARPGGAVDFV
jgi:sarcosine oxidase subunit gamma